MVKSRFIGIDRSDSVYLAYCSTQIITPINIGRLRLSHSILCDGDVMESSYRYGIPILRLGTNESGEEARLNRKLNEVLKLA